MIAVLSNPHRASMSTGSLRIRLHHVGKLIQHNKPPIGRQADDLGNGGILGRLAKRGGHGRVGTEKLKKCLGKPEALSIWTDEYGSHA
jgi:hypothetical protein